MFTFCRIHSKLAKISRLNFSPLIYVLYSKGNIIIIIIIIIINEKK